MGEIGGFPAFQGGADTILFGGINRLFSLFFKRGYARKKAKFCDVETPECDSASDCKLRKFLQASARFWRYGGKQ